MSHRVIERLIAWRWAFLALALVIAAAAFPVAWNMRFDRSIENMFAANDPLLDAYDKLKRTFGGNEIVLLVYEDPQLFDPAGAGLDRLKVISRKCNKIPGVAAVLSLERILGEQGAQIVDEDNPLAERMRDLFENYTHSASRRTAAIVCMLEPQDATEVPRETTIARLRKIVEDLPDGTSGGVLAGEPVMVVEGFRYLEEDGRRLGMWSTLLLAITITLCFRSLRWVLIPVVVVQWTLVTTRAALVVSGLRLSMVSSMLTAIVTVVGVATVVHVIVRFREARAAGAEPRAALLQAGTLVAAPVFWACSTDAIGFLSLTVSNVGPVQDFGIMMAFGSLFVLVAAALLIPGLALAGSRSRHFVTTAGEQRISDVLNLALERVLRHRRVCLWGLGGLSVLALGGLFRLEIETDFTKNFRQGSPVVVAYDVVERELGGAGVMDIVLPAPDKLSWDYVQRVVKLEEELRSELGMTRLARSAQPGLTKVLSLADAIAQGAPVDIGSLPAFARGLSVRAAMVKIRDQMPAFAAAMYSSDPHTGQHFFRVMLRTPEQQDAQDKLRLIAQVESIGQRHFPASEQEAAAEVTGFFVLLANLVQSILRDQWLAFSVALVGIGGMMWFCFGSLRMALVTLIPNALPVLLVLGCMGWLGGRVNMGVAMIAAVSLGLSVDSSIHYVTFFRRALRAGQSPQEALAGVQHTVGRAVVFSTLALIVGFTVLCASEFVPTIYFGLLVSLAMLGGLLGNLFLLPILLTTGRECE